MYEVKVWRNRHDYEPGMELGEPDEIVLVPERSLYIPFRDDGLRERRIRGGAKNRENGSRLTQTLYEKHKEEGMKNADIAEMYGITTGTLHSKRYLWRKADRAKAKLAIKGLTTQSHHPIKDIK